MDYFPPPLKEFDFTKLNFEIKLLISEKGGKKRNYLVKATPLNLLPLKRAARGGSPIPLLTPQFELKFDLMLQNDVME